MHFASRFNHQMSLSKTSLTLPGSVESSCGLQKSCFTRIEEALSCRKVWFRTFLTRISQRKISEPFRFFHPSAPPRLIKSYRRGKERDGAEGGENFPQLFSMRKSALLWALLCDLCIKREKVFLFRRLPSVFLSFCFIYSAIKYKVACTSLCIG